MRNMKYVERAGRWLLAPDKLLDRLLWLVAVIGGLYLVGFGLNHLTISLFNSLLFDGFAADGPFQLYNPLRRLAAGEVIGRDFQFFHGIGIPLAHFPLFKLMGSNIFASEFARWMVSAMAFVGSAGVLFYAAFRNWPRTLVATAVATWGTLFYVDVISPTNSLLGIRTTVPLLFAAVYLWNPQANWRIRAVNIPVKPLILGLLAAFGLLFGTEQGVAIVAGYGLAELFTHRRNLRRFLVSMLWFGAAAVVAVLGLMTALTAGHTFEVLNYSLREVAGDQSWYFSTQPQEYLKWDTFWRQITAPFLPLTYGFGVLTIGLLLVLRRFGWAVTRHAQATVFLLGYGVAAFVVPALGGYFAPGQAVPLMRMNVVLLTLFLVLAMSEFVRRVRTTDGVGRYTVAARIGVMVVLGAVCAGGAIKGVALVANANNLDMVRLVKMVRWARHTDDYAVLSPGWKGGVDVFRSATNGNPSVWSTYASLYESQAGLLHPSSQGHDYIIHALGTERRAHYEQEFIDSRPDYTVTMRPSYFAFEEWVWARHWHMYRYMLQNYRLIAANASHNIWRHEASAAPTSEPTWKDLPLGSDGWANLPKPSAGTTPTIYEVKVDYEAKAGLPLTTKLPKYLVRLRNNGNTYDVSLPPTQTSWQFPVSSWESLGAPGLHPIVEGLFPGTLNMKRIQYREVAMEGVNRRMFTENYCYPYHSDGTGKPLSNAICDAFNAEKL